MRKRASSSRYFILEVSLPVPLFRYLSILCTEGYSLSQPVTLRRTSQSFLSFLWNMTEYQPFGI